ncbi:hypothetical protein [Ferrovibrio sp.]|uniref:hypothetical protein n=1 Tax=Ferrovibrio sp. TaxID=1917215 RepID=UPI003D2989EE
MIQVQRRYIRWALWLPLLIAAPYLILPQCFSQQIILVNARGMAVENLTLWLQPNQQEAKPLWCGHLPAQVTVFLGFDPGYGQYTQRLVSEDTSVDIEFGYFTHSIRNIVVIGRNETDAFYLNNLHAPCYTGDSINCLISLAIAPIRNQACRPW